MTGQRSFGADELGTDRPDELHDALTAAAWLDAATDVPPVTPSAGFGDRVMAALADEPAPSTAGFLVPLRRRGFLGGLVASVRQAWVTFGGGGRPVFARAMALAYVLAAVIAGASLAGVTTIGVAGALGMFNPPSIDASPSPLPFESTAPLPTELPSAPSESPQVEVSSEPSESPEASGDDGGSGGPEPSDDHGGNSGPEPSDDHGGSASPSPSPSGSDDDNSGPGSSDSGSSTPRPSRTPSPTDTPDPTQTPDN